MALIKWHTKYQRPVPSNFTQEDFLSQAYNLNNLGIGLLDNAAYQNIKGLGLLVSYMKIFLSVSLYGSMLNK